jgi:hypothetical protein
MMAKPAAGGESLGRRSRRRRNNDAPEETIMRGVIRFLLSLIIGIAILWIGFWWYAEHRLQSGFAAWAEQQAADGWKVSTGSVQRGTSPMRAELNITQLTLTPPPGPDGEVVTIALPSVGLRIDALNPLVFHTDLPNQIAITAGDAIGLVINTGSIALSENLDPGTLFNRHAYPFRGGDFAASNIQILASSLLVLHIDSITSHADVDLTAGANAAAISSLTVLNGLALSPLLTRIGSVPFDGKLAQLSLAATFSGPVPDKLAALAGQVDAAPHDPQAQEALLMPVIQKWAAAGGNGKIALHALIGPSTLAASGNLAFDANLQPTGTADLSADRLGAFTAALTNAYPQLQDDVAQAEAELSPYIGNTPQGGQTLTMHVTYGAGSVTINGQKVAAMPPVDWTALENPPPPPAPAPGDGSGAASPAPASP